MWRAHAISVRMREKQNQALSPLRRTWYLFMYDQFSFILCNDPFSCYLNIHDNHFLKNE